MISNNYWPVMKSYFSKEEVVLSFMRSLRLGSVSAAKKSHPFILVKSNKSDIS